MKKTIFKFSMLQIILVSIMTIIVSQKSKLPQSLVDGMIVAIGCCMIIAIITFIVKLKYEYK